MKMEIVDLKKSERGTEVIGFVPYPVRDTVIAPDIPYLLSLEEKEKLRSPYLAMLKKTTERHENEKRDLKRLHLGSVNIAQEEDEFQKDGNKG